MAVTVQKDSSCKQCTSKTPTPHWPVLHQKRIDNGEITVFESFELKTTESQSISNQGL